MKIKALKCPQCGSSKAVKIDKNHYRCSKCDTEFILDNEDINVNINHRYEYDNVEKHPISLKKTGLTILAVFIAVVSFIIFINLTKTNPVRLPVIKEHSVHPYLLSIGDDAVLFEIIQKMNLLSAGDNQYTALFRDVVTGAEIKKQTDFIADDLITDVSYRKFRSDNAHYAIINNTYLYKIGRDTLINMESEISSRKPALNSGFSEIGFLPESSGEGFLLTTNLGKEFYYYPTTDALYTEEAFRYIITGKFGTLSPDAQDVIYYLFRNRESRQSKNVATLLEITYKSDSGGVENKLEQATEDALKHLENYRIVSYKPINEERSCFEPEVLYYDHDNILIAYKETLAEDAVFNIELLNTEGEVLWNTPLESGARIICSVRTDQGFMLQNSDGDLCGISKDGESKQSYKLSK